MRIENLIKQFNEFDLERLSQYGDLLSSKLEDEIFPPYIPHVGEKYSRYRLMLYGTSQSMVKPWPELTHMTRKLKIRQLFDAADFHDIAIAPYKVMLAISGIYLFAQHQCRLENFADIHNQIAASNYYKFSFNRKKRDVNPNTALEKYIDPIEYWALNDQLSTMELGTLNPATVISFNGRPIRAMRKAGYKVLQINDPAWVLRGGSGVLQATGSWYREINDPKVNSLVDSYLEQIDDKYSGKKEALKIYMLKYYNDWKKG